MDIALNIPDSPRQREFLDYLNSALRQRIASYSGSANYTDDGSFQSSIQGPFIVEQEPVELIWKITKGADGTLLSLAIESVDSSIPVATWHTPVYEFVTSVLATAFVEKRQKFFRRSLFFYVGPQLDGEYWLPGYRFAPAYPDDPHPHLINAERVVCIDQDVYAIDANHAFALSEEASRRHSARLSLLLNVGLYGPEHCQRWVWPIIDDKPANESVRLQLGFNHPSLSLQEMPQKGNLCNLGGYKGSLAARFRVAGELQSLPREARKILRGVDSADPLIADAFDRGARLYQVALVCGRFFPSVGLAYRVAAVEAISKADKECNSFSDFMRKHITSQSDIGVILNYLYGDARSGHFHGGSFPMGEFNRRNFFDPLMDSEAVGRDSLHRTCYELTREAIVNWLNQMIPESPELSVNESSLPIEYHDRSQKKIA